MLRLFNALKAWDSDEFEAVFKAEVAGLEKHLLPMQAGLANSSHVNDSPFEPVVLTTSKTDKIISVKTVILYSGILAGSCCADDPAPVCEENEYCALQFDIDKGTGETTIVLL